MSFTDWKTETINDILPEEFYNLILKNTAHIEKTFPVTLSHCLDLEKTKQFIAFNQDKENHKEGYYFYPRDLKSKALIGYLCIKSIDNQKAKCELGYFIDEDYQGRGVTSKVVSETLDFCFNTLKMNKVFICTSKINKASQQIALKHHFKQEGILREEFKSSDGTLEDVVYFGLLKSEYITHER
ncbi:GNAT family N-acetyltransferase [Flavobacterium sp. ANB]|uniref:GNAT family N-acetyltransferase n=1 Tax=unclassified Flavobacterium TaxID=196869 RepID=UPI0012B6E948|nr:MULTISPECIES: GNAT family protein [unclassified Flavobacterium]MBF4517055.1 GNAT family N-acetyltransferase [Flavobacterium sp. ANB]MTD71792.1 GNAT family N-acetyltransferase [Flavobacterium sp. LC2016-13]